jgi:shikimate kinase
VKEDNEQPQSIDAPAGRAAPGGNHLVTLSPCHLVFLVGLRGSGKTTVARLLAGRLGWSWLDADEVLEERAGCSIRAVFAAEGEAGFREREARVLAELAQRSRHVIATGGGVVLREDNRALLGRGRVVWLTADAETLWSRVRGDGTTAERRPALTVGGREEAAELLRVREPLYRACADLVVSTAGRSPEEVAEDVHAALSGALAR